jgi:hypothetical protein
MFIRTLAPLVISAGLIASLVSAPGTVAEPMASPATLQTLQPAAPAAITGTPIQLLATLPVTEPLTVGYKPGLFNSPTDLKKTDKRGCTYRNQMLLKLATKKPKIGKKCTLSGGEWRVDFGRTVVKKASQVKLGKLLPDKFVYAQGAYGWTPDQRKAYANSTTTVAKSTRMSTRGTTRGSIDENNLQLLSSSGLRVATLIGRTLSDTRDPSAVEQELAGLKSQSPEFFESWTVASLLNAKSWGLSFSLGLYSSSSKTLSECSKGGYTLISFTGRVLESADPCNNIYSIINQAAVFKIVPIPVGSSQTPPVSSTVLSGYGTPQGAPIDRSLFGIHAPADWDSDEASGFEGGIKQATIPKVPVGYVRLWDTETTWKDIEPANGRYVWRKLDKQIELAQRLNARVMLVLGGTPAWAGDSSVQSNPRSIDDWRDYVGTVACKYGTFISAFEIWNEANLQTFWKGTPAEMAELTKVAFEEIRRCNPGALVVAANTTSRATGSFGTFFPAYLEEMKKRNWPADAYSVHSYPSASGGADDRIKGISQFRSMLALAGAPFTTTFDTEINYGLAGLGEGKVDLSGANAMTLLSRTYIDSARYGFGSTFWFVWTANPDSKFGIQLTDASANEQLAWRTTYDWLVGAQYQRCFETPEKVIVCQFNKGADNFSLVWRGDVNSPTSLTSAGYFAGLGSQACDLYGTCITAAAEIPVGPMPQRISGPALASGVAGPSQPAKPQAPTPPAAPTSSVPTDVRAVGSANAETLETSFRLTWKSVVDATSYDVEYRLCTNQADQSTCSAWTVGTAAASATSADFSVPRPGVYEVRIRALGARSGQPAWVSTTVGVPTGPVTPATSVNAWGSSDNFRVLWTSSTLATKWLKGYRIQMQYNDPQGTVSQWQDVLATSGSMTTSVLSAKSLGTKPNDIVRFRVITVPIYGADSRASNPSPRRQQTDSVPAPLDFEATYDAVTDYLTMTWKNPVIAINGGANVGGYDFAYKWPGSNTWTQLGSPLSYDPQKAVFSLENVPRGLFQVRVRSISWPEKLYSDWTMTRSVRK